MNLKLNLPKRTFIALIVTLSIQSTAQINMCLNYFNHQASIQTVQKFLNGNTHGILYGIDTLDLAPRVTNGDWKTILIALQNQEARYSNSDYLFLLKQLMSLAPQEFSVNGSFKMTHKIQNSFSSAELKSFAFSFIKIQPNDFNFRWITKLYTNDYLKLMEDLVFVNPKWIIKNFNLIINKLAVSGVEDEIITILLNEIASVDPKFTLLKLSQYLNLIDTQEVLNILAKAAKKDLATVLIHTQQFRAYNSEQVRDFLLNALTAEQIETTIVAAFQLLDSNKLNSLNFIEFISAASKINKSYSITIANENSNILRKHKILTEVRKIIAQSEEIRLPSIANFTRTNAIPLTYTLHRKLKGIENARSNEEILQEASNIYILTETDIQYLSQVLSITKEFSTGQALVREIIKLKFQNKPYEFYEGSKVDRLALYTAITGLNFRLIKSALSRDYEQILINALDIQDYSANPFFENFEIPAMTYLKPGFILKLVTKTNQAIETLVGVSIRELPEARYNQKLYYIQLALESASDGVLLLNR